MKGDRVMWFCFVNMCCVDRVFDLNLGLHEYARSTQPSFNNPTTERNSFKVHASIHFSDVIHCYKQRQRTARKRTNLEQSTTPVTNSPAPDKVICPQLKRDLESRVCRWRRRNFTVVKEQYPLQRGAMRSRLSAFLPHITLWCVWCGSFTTILSLFHLTFTFTGRGDITYAGLHQPQSLLVLWSVVDLTRSKGMRVIESRKRSR